jgi:hypothetical protein
MASELQTLFEDELDNKQIQDVRSVAQKAIDEAEREFLGHSAAVESRIAEKAELEQKISKLRRELQQCANVKNIRLAHVNAERAKKRKKIRADIALCQLRLADIAEEEKGAQLSVSDFVKE